MYQTDDFDLKIIDLLLEDGRMPAAEIARRAGGISERTVRYRIGRMTADGLIRISAIVDPRRFGYPVTADIFIQVETSQIQNVAEQLAANELVSYVACAIGERDVSVQVVAKDAQAVFEFATQVIGPMPGVIKTITSIVPVVLKDVYRWRPGKGISCWWPACAGRLVISYWLLVISSLPAQAGWQNPNNHNCKGCIRIPDRFNPMRHLFHVPG